MMVCTPAGAQPVFVQGVYGPDVRRFSGDETDLVFDSGAGSFALTVGGFVTRHVVVALEIDWGQRPGRNADGQPHDCRAPEHHHDELLVAPPDVFRAGGPAHAGDAARAVR